MLRTANRMTALFPLHFGFSRPKLSPFSSGSPIRQTQWLLANLGKSKHQSMTEAQEPLDVKEYNSQWEAYWQEGVAQGEYWDAGSSAPSLKQLIASDRLEVEGKRFVVPGCGRGYDVIEFAKAGAYATGLELSETAVKVASAYRDAQVDPHLIPRITFKQGDFFQLEQEEGAFDGGYDYTFLCAIHTDMRPDWAKQWARLIAKGGTLVTLLYPVKPEKLDGPPFHVDPQEIKKILEANGFDCKELNPVDASMSYKDRAGHEYLGIFTRV